MESQFRFSSLQYIDFLSSGKTKQNKDTFKHKFISFRLVGFFSSFVALSSNRSFLSLKKFIINSQKENKLSPLFSLLFICGGLKSVIRLSMISGRANTSSAWNKIDEFKFPDSFFWSLRYNKISESSFASEFSLRIIYCVWFVSLEHCFSMKKISEWQIKVKFTRV